MAWTTRFIEQLVARRRTPMFVLEIRNDFTNAPGVTWRIGSHSAVGALALIDPQSVTTSGSTLTPRTWASTVGTFSLDIVGTTKKLLEHLTRGTIVALRVGWSGWAEDEYEIVALGQVWSLTGRAPRWTLDCRDLMAAMRQRLETTYGEYRLFGGLTATATVALTYTPADTELAVDTVTGFDSVGVSDGVVLVTPTTGDPFYLRYYDVDAGAIPVPQFTGVEATGQFGTTAASTAIGSAVAEVAHLEEHPLNVARWLLASTTGGTNGVYDILPSGWAGLGIPDELIDHDEINAYKDEVLVPLTGTYVWNVLALTPEEDAIAWIAGVFAPAGIFITTRQGMVTVRAIQDTQSAVIVASDLKITDADFEMAVDAVEDAQAWDVNTDAEYQFIWVRGGDGTGWSSSLEDAATLPTVAAADIDVPHVWQNTLEIAAEIVSRVSEAWLRGPGAVFAVRLVGLRLAQAAAGDIIPIESSRLAAPWSPDGLDCNVEVLDVTVDWVGGRVSLTFVAYPPTADGL